MLHYYKIQEVVRIIDGDTFVCVLDLGFNLFKKIHVRLINFDSLEIHISKRCRHQAQEYNLSETIILNLGVLMRNKLKTLLEQNKNNLFLKSHKLDSFGRCLASIYINDKDIKEELEEYKKQLILENKGNYKFSVN